MNRPKYKELYYREKAKAKNKEIQFNNLIELIGQLGEMKVSDRIFNLEGSFNKGRAIEISNINTGKTRWMSFIIDED